jgi:ABC-type multidrug transport system fused ATPase/permease subunit
MDILMVIAALLIILVPLVSRVIKSIPEQPAPMSNKKRKELEKWYDKSFNEILELRLKRFEKEEEREAFRKEKTEEYLQNKFKNQKKDG